MIRETSPDSQTADMHPDEPSALFKNALEALSQNQPTAAVELLQRAIFVRYSQPLYHLKLGEAYQALHRFDDAGDAFGTALRLSPKLWQAHVGLGKILGAQGKEAEATPHLKEAAKLMAAERKKNLSISLQLLGYRLIATAFGNRGKAVATYAQLRVGKLFEERGDTDVAIARYRAATALSPDDVKALTALGRAYRKAQLYGKAVEILSEAKVLAPNDPEILVQLGWALAWQGDPAAAQLLVQRALTEKPECAEAHAALGWSLQYQGESLRAIDEFEESLRLGLSPDSIDARIGLASCLEDAGRIDAALEHWKSILTERPCTGYAWFRISRATKYNKTDSEIRQIERCQSNEDISTNDRRYLLFAAGKMYDDIEEVDRAFDCYDLANKLDDVFFDPNVTSQKFKELTDTFRRILFQRYGKYGSPSERPIFVVGMPRSGTSLIEQILSSHPDVFGAGELPHIQTLTKKLPEVLDTGEPYPACINHITASAIRDLSDLYLDSLDKQSDKAVRVIDKMPGNFQHLGFIQILFPNARIIHCVRDPLDTCLSIYMTPFRESHPYRSNLTHLGHFYHQYRKLMEHWHRELLMPVFDVRYEDLTTEPEGTSRRLVEFCGLGWDDRCLMSHKADRLVHTASNLQVRQPIYTSSLGRYRRYTKHLIELRRILEDSTEQSLG